jgi:hypothetical protein
MAKSLVDKLHDVSDDAIDRINELEMENAELENEVQELRKQLRLRDAMEDLK